MEVRQYSKKTRNSIPKELREEKALGIIDKVLALLKSDFKGAYIFLCFYPFGSEVNLMKLYEVLLDRGAQLYFPVSNKADNSLSFYRVLHLRNDFHKGAYNIMEPDDSLPEFNYEAIERNKSRVICLVPGVAFDTKLNRIGYGGGYYDRFLSNKAGIIKIAPIYSEQLFKAIDVEEHDIPMDYIITENKILKGDKLCH